MKRALVVALAILLILPFAACDPAASEESLQEAIARAVSNMSQALSYREAGNLVYCHEGIVGYQKYEGEYAAPDGWCLSRTWTWENGDSLTAIGSGATKTAWNEFTVIGETAYRRSSIEPEWRICELSEPPPGPSPPSPTVTPSISPGPAPTALPTSSPSPPLFPPPQAAGTASPTAVPSGATLHGHPPAMLEGSPSPTPTQAPSTDGCSFAVLTLEKSLEFLDYLVDLEELPDEEVDGVTCSHYRGRVDQNALMDMAEKQYEDECGQVPEELRELLDLTRRQSQDVELWIDEDDYLRLLAVVGRYPMPDSGTGEETWGSSRAKVHFYDFDEVITIEPPVIEGE